MGALADAALDEGAEVIGVLPRGLFVREVAHTGISYLYQVESMHARKALMADLADGFIALPGGFGTFDELFEILTWAQIGLHRKPIGLLDIQGYFAPLFALVKHAIREGFVAADHAPLLLRARTSAALLDALAAYQPVAPLAKWVTPPPER